MFEDLEEDMEVNAKIQMQMMESQMNQVKARRSKMSGTKTPMMSCSMLVIILVKLQQKSIEKEDQSMLGEKWTSQKKGAQNFFVYLLYQWHG